MAINFDTLNQVYNHYMTSYAPRSSSLDTHKKSELKGIYNRIVKLNKQSPLFLLNNTDEAKNYAISLKENARGLHNTIMSLGSMDEDALLSKKAAYSSNDALASATYIADDAAAPFAPEVDIAVKELASPQVNMGKFLIPDSYVGLKADTYSMDLSIRGLSYEFQFGISNSDTNSDLQNRLARLVNGANIGVSAEVITNDKGQTSLKLTGLSTGANEDGNPTFVLSDNDTSKTSGVVDYLGIGEVARHPGNAVFSVDGVERTAYSNHFTLDKTYEVTLNGVSINEDDVAHIGLKASHESLKENIGTLLSGYNDFLKSATASDTTGTKGRVLAAEMNRLSAAYADQLSYMGITRSEDGTFAIDSGKLDQVAIADDITEPLQDLKQFAGSLLRKTDEIALNPMRYVNRTVVAYKHPAPQRNFPAPYAASEYSGMLFNFRC